MPFSSIITLLTCLGTWNVHVEQLMNHAQAGVCVRMIFELIENKDLKATINDNYIGIIAFIRNLLVAFRISLSICSFEFREYIKRDFCLLSSNEHSGNVKKT